MSTGLFAARVRSTIARRRRSQFFPDRFGEPAFDGAPDGIIGRVRGPAGDVRAWPPPIGALGGTTVGEEERGCTIGLDGREPPVGIGPMTGGLEARRDSSPMVTGRVTGVETRPVGADTFVLGEGFTVTGRGSGDRGPSPMVTGRVTGVDTRPVGVPTFGLGAGFTVIGRGSALRGRDSSPTETGRVTGVNTRSP